MLPIGSSHKGGYMEIYCKNISWKQATRAVILYGELRYLLFNSSFWNICFEKFHIFQIVRVQLHIVMIGTTVIACRNVSAINLRKKINFNSIPAYNGIGEFEFDD